MDNNLRTYLYETKQAFIDASIHRVANSGDMMHGFWLSVDAILSGAGKARATENLLNSVSEFFSSFKIHADYQEAARGFDIQVNLERARLEPQEAAFFSAAVSAFRVEHT